MKMNAIQKAIKCAGTKAELSRWLNVPPTRIRDWEVSRAPLPLKYAAAIERVTRGEVTACELLPDVAKIFASCGKKGKETEADDL